MRRIAPIVVGLVALAIVFLAPFLAPPRSTGTDPVTTRSPTSEQSERGGIEAKPVAPAATDLAPQVTAPSPSVTPNEDKPIDPDATGGVASNSRSTSSVLQTAQDIPETPELSVPLAPKNSDAPAIAKVLMGARVQDRSGEPVGEVRSLRIDQMGKVQYVVIAIGGSTYAVRAADLSYGIADNVLTSGLSKAEITDEERYSAPAAASAPPPR